MTKEELVDKYLTYKGLTRKKNGKVGDSLAPILPFLMMDVEYQLFCKHILPLKVKFLAKKLRNEWSECYTKGNKEFFGAYTNEEQEGVTDLMDDFESYIETPLEDTKKSILKYCETLEEKDREVATICLLCNVLSQAASYTWSHIYRTKKMTRDINPWIEGVKKCSINFSNEWYKGGRGVNCNDSEDIQEKVDILCSKMIEWLIK